MKREYPKHPIIAVGVVVVKDNKILLIQRAKPPKTHSWSIPGGAQELGETIQQAAIREVQEETAITIENPVFLTVVDYIERDETSGIKHHYTLIDYAANYLSGTLKAGDDAMQAKWVPIEQLSEYNLWSETEKLIFSALKKLKDGQKLENDR